MSKNSTLHLISPWFIKPGCEAGALRALDRLARDVRANEPDTLAYMIHRPHPDTKNLVSLPPVVSTSILFFEIYRDVDAFLRHVNGPVFTGFVKEHGALFVNANGHPFTMVEFLEMHAGFVRPEVVSPVEGHDDNRHPGVMFEVIAKNQEGLKQFYAETFGWHYQTGTGNFAYVHFGTQTTPLLGGIGQTNPSPGFEPGHNFYLRVENLEAAIAKAVAAGGSRFVEPAEIDGYRFAMVKDPEDNPVGLIEPFAS